MSAHDATPTSRRQSREEVDRQHGFRDAVMSRLGEPGANGASCARRIPGVPSESEGKSSAVTNARSIPSTVGVCIDDGEALDEPD